MKILIISQHGKAQVKDSDAIPRIGDKIDIFYEPSPTVTQVLWWPSKERLAELQFNAFDIQVIIIVS